MRHEDGIGRVVEEIEYLRAKQRRAAFFTPRLVISYSIQTANGSSETVDRIESAYLKFGAAVFPLSLSQTGLLIAVVLARKRPRPLTARQIEQILAVEPIYVKLRMNMGVPRVPGYRSIKVYIMRLRRQLEDALERIANESTTVDLLNSEITEVSNVVAYRLVIACEFIKDNKLQRDAVESHTAASPTPSKPSIEVTKTRDGIFARDN